MLIACMARHDAKWWADRLEEVTKGESARDVATRYGVREKTLIWWRSELERRSRKKQRLAPRTYPSDIVIMDNLGIHKMRVVCEAILDASGFPVFRATYSPELTPIERPWAVMKRRLRTLAINTGDELLLAVRRPRASTPIAKIAAWFRHSLPEAQFH